MQLLPTIPYPENEKTKLAELETLFRAWHQHFADNEAALPAGQKAGDMVFDGFYPHYFSQKWRILFIAREARQIAGLNYLDVLFSAYRTGKRIGEQHLNVNQIHSRMLYIAYGILNGMAEWKDIPYASKIGDSFGSAEGVSFAFMNISKLSNEADAWQSDWNAINSAHRLSSSSRSFNEDEVKIMEPHIVITMNLGEKLASLGQRTEIGASDGVRSFWLESGGHRSLLLDTFHFSSRKDPITEIYLPVCDAIRKNLA